MEKENEVQSKALMFKYLVDRLGKSNCMSHGAKKIGKKRMFEGGRDKKTLKRTFNCICEDKSSQKKLPYITYVL